MSPLETLGFALGTSFASGLNLYATVAITLFLVGFIADKIPYVDSAWDALHTFIRPPAAAVLAYSAFGNVPEEYKIGAALLAGSVALTAHGAKASARAAANTSPEPVSNWALSSLEDGLAVFLVWMAAEHPLLTAGIVLVLLVIAVLLIRKLWKFSRQLVERVRRKPAGSVGPPAGV